MPVIVKKLIEAISVIAENRAIQVSTKHALKGTGVVAGSTLIVSLLMGSRGFLIGALLGGLLAFMMSEGNYNKTS